MTRHHRRTNVESVVIECYSDDFSNYQGVMKLKSSGRFRHSRFQVVWFFIFRPFSSDLEIGVDPLTS